MIKIAITGNIGTGKTTVSQIIKSLGYNVFESDEAVKRIFEKKDIIQRIKKSFGTLESELFDDTGNIDKSELGNLVFSNKDKLKKLEKIVHPEIWKMQKKFAYDNSENRVVFFDIPLLFEKGLQKKYDYIFYTYVSYKIQKKRVLERKNMTEEKFRNIIKNQINYKNIDKSMISLKLNTQKDKNIISEEIKFFLINLLAKKILR